MPVIVAMQIILNDNRLVIELSEGEAKVFEKTLPIAIPYTQALIIGLIKMLIIFITQGEEVVPPYLERIKLGESPWEVSAEMLSKFNITIDTLLSEVEMPPDDEIRKALGWDK